MEEKILFRELLGALRVKWYIIATSFGIFICLGFIYSFTKTPVYTAFTVLQVEEPINRKTLLEDLFIYGRPSRIETEMEIIRSRSVAERVAQKYLLDVDVKEIRGNLTFKIKKLQVDRRFTGVPIRLHVEKNCENYTARANGKVLEKEELVIEFLYCKGEGVAVISKKAFEDAVKEVKEGVKTEKIGELTNLIKVSFSSTDPVKAAEITNAIADAYIEFNKEKWTEDISQTMDFISSQLEKVKEQLKEAEEKMDSFRKTYGIAEISREAEGIIEKLSTLEKEKTSVEIELFEVKRALNDIEKDASRILSSNFNDPVIQSLTSRLAELDIKRYALLQKFTENHPEVVAVDAERKEIIEKIKELLKEKENALTTRKKGLEDFINRYETEIRKYPETERNLLRLARNLKVNEEIYTFLLTKYEEVRIAKAASVGNIKVIDRAIPPQIPVSPNKKKILLFCGFSGLTFGFIMAFLIYYLSDTISSPEEIETSFKIPVFGVIPEIDKDELNNSGTTDLPFTGALKEAGRIMKTTIQYSPNSSNISVFLITSPMHGEGKTTITRLLGEALSEGGRKTLLIDADLRKRGLSKTAGLEGKKGFVDLLAGSASLDESVFELRENLFLLPAGAYTSISAAFLESKKLEETISDMKSSFSYILLDSPPLLSVVDSLILSKAVEGVLMVITTYKTSRLHFTKCIRFLKNIKVNIAGCIVNRIQTGRGGYYYYYYMYPENDVKPGWKRLIKKRRKKHEV